MYIKKITIQRTKITINQGLQRCKHSKTTAENSISLKLIFILPTKHLIQ